MARPSVYLRGQPVSVVKTFLAVDPLGVEPPVAENPDGVVFLVLDPDNSEVSYTWGTDAEVTNPQTGVFLLSLPPQLPPGSWRWRCESTGTGLVDAEEGAFDVLESSVLEPDPPTVAVTGPCSSWINGDDVEACGPDLGLGSSAYLLDDVAYAASDMCYQLSGRQFPGVCERTSVRPVVRVGYSRAAGEGYWGWTSALYPGGGWMGSGYQDQWERNASWVLLPGYPVREILEVVIDGVTLPLIDPATGAPNYRLDRRRRLVRLWLPPLVEGGPPQQMYWPLCTNTFLQDDQPNTWSVAYTWGADVPALGRMAAAELARELWNACNGQPCKLPNRVTQTVRQGITMIKIQPLADLLRGGASGIAALDMFIATYNPSKQKRRSAVWSPDFRFSQRVGQ